MDEYAEALQRELVDTKRALKAVLLTTGPVEVSDEMVVIADDYQVEVVEHPMQESHTVLVEKR